MLFVGTYPHTIDAKGRLAIPADIRQGLDAAVDGKGLFAALQEGRTLCLYTETGFQRRSAELDSSQRPSDEVLLYEQMFYSLAQRLELDEQGRVRLPEDLLKLAGLGQEVVLIGVKDHLQVHDRKAWLSQRERLLAKRPDLLMNPRRWMRDEPVGRPRGKK